MRLSVSFSKDGAAKEVKEIMQAAQDWIFSNMDEERYLGNYLANEGISEGIHFDSFWVPSGAIEREGNILKFELVGSPGDDLPGDIVLWLGKRGAINAKGTLEISGTGDVIEIDHTF